MLTTSIQTTNVVTTNIMECDNLVNNFNFPNIPLILKVGALFIPAAWDEKLFPEPHVLKPERHLDSDGKFVRNDNLAPFGVGKFHIPIEILIEH